MSQVAMKEGFETTNSQLDRRTKGKNGCYKQGIKARQSSTKVERSSRIRDDPRRPKYGTLMKARSSAALSQDMTELATPSDPPGKKPVEILTSSCYTSSFLRPCPIGKVRIVKSLLRTTQSAGKETEEWKVVRCSRNKEVVLANQRRSWSAQTCCEGDREGMCLLLRVSLDQRDVVYSLTFMGAKLP